MQKVRIALIHEFLGSTKGGQEEVLREFHAMYPHAPIYTLIADRKHLGEAYQGWDIRPSFIQKFPFAQTNFQMYLSLMPQAIESMDLRNFDVVISSSSAFAKGVLTSPHTLHVCYCHTPTRYLWSDAHTYVQERRVVWPLRAAVTHYLTHLRMWDRLAADRPDHMIANSKAVQGRIERYYRRASQIIYPPVDVASFSLGSGRGDYFLTGGRLVESKRFDMVVQAFNRLRVPLVIFGTGRDEKRLRRMAGHSVRFAGYLSREARAKVFQDAKAFIYPQVEDFGITAVESMASGRPVIAYGAGGTLETVHEGVTGTFFQESTWECLADTVARFNPDVFSPTALRAHAERFSIERFQNEIRTFIADAWEKHENNTRH